MTAKASNPCTVRANFTSVTQAAARPVQTRPGRPSDRCLLGDQSGIGAQSGSWLGPESLLFIPSPFELCLWLRALIIVLTCSYKYRMNKLSESLPLKDSSEDSSHEAGSACSTVVQYRQP